MEVSVYVVCQGESDGFFNARSFLETLNASEVRK